jgi:anti-sigma factor RsiW
MNTPDSPSDHQAQWPTLGPQEYLTCRQVLDFLMAYLDHELTADQRREFERHLSVCPSCVNYLRSYQSTIALGKDAMLTRGTDPDAPASSVIPEGLLRAVREARRSERGS